MFRSCHAHGLLSHPLVAVAAEADDEVGHRLCSVSGYGGLALLDLQPHGTAHEEADQEHARQLLWQWDGSGEGVVEVAGPPFALPHGLLVGGQVDGLGQAHM